jgi:predicted  nucleic acid-binding Zn-ribbon protein
MHKDMNALRELQQIDSAIAELEADLAALDDGSELRAKLAEAEEELSRRQGARDDQYGTQQKKEADLEKADGKLKQLMDKAYGGVVSNPKELETLEQEIAAVTRMKDRLENELLELFDVVDEQVQASRTQEELAADLRSQLDETVGTYESERARLTEQIASLRGERAGIEGTIEPASLRKYEHIRERCANLAVVAIEDGMCSGCRVGLPVVRIRRVLEGSELEQCENCFRLLWIHGD